MKINQIQQKYKKIPVGRSKNLTNYKFGHLTVLYKTNVPKGKKKGTYWVCECDCSQHNIIVVRSDRLTSGEKTNCGCCQKKIGRPIHQIPIGTKFGKWTVIAFKGVINGHAYWLCQCDCGTEKVQLGSALLRGETTCCEKCRGIKKRIDLTGRRFGKLVALYPTDKKKGPYIVWKCKCDCGKQCEVPSEYLITGQTKSCGCIKNSYNEEKIQSMLLKNHILFVTQKTFNDFKFITTKYPGYFDFFVNNQYIIEYDGEQHFHYRKNDSNTWNTKENFQITREHDLEKNKYCFQHKIPIIRIPYNIEYTIDDLELETTRFLLTPENEEKYYDRS